MNEDTIYEVVVKLVGNISPIGETRTDKINLENLKKMGILVQKLAFDIHHIKNTCKNSHEYSVQEAQKEAEKISNDIKDILSEDYEEA